MKKDIVLIKKILLKTEEKEDSRMELILIDGYSREQCIEHAILLDEGNYVQAIECGGQSGDDRRIKKLTNNGHDLLAQLSNNKNWENIMSLVKAGMRISLVKLAEIMMTGKPS